MKDLQKIYNICTCMARSLIEAHLFESMDEDEDEYDYDHTLIDDSSAQGDDKEKLKWKRQFQHVVIETKLMQLQVENDLHDDEEQSELRHALDIVLIDEHENVEITGRSLSAS